MIHRVDQLLGGCVSQRHRFRILVIAWHYTINAPRARAGEIELPLKLRRQTGRVLDTSRDTVRHIQPALGPDCQLHRSEPDCATARIQFPDRRVAAVR